jgi:replicative DNA helicase
MIGEFEHNIIIKEYPAKGASLTTIKSHYQKTADLGFKADLILIDYVDLLKPPSRRKDRKEEIDDLHYGTKGLAKELNIPVIALSQLSRSVESRQDKKPMLQDLRESGQIEQDADMVLFCYRPEYYHIDQYEVDGRTFEAHGLFMLIIAKHRNGALDKVRLRFIGEYARFDNLESYNEETVPAHTNMGANTDFVAPSPASYTVPS